MSKGDVLIMSSILIEKLLKLWKSFGDGSHSQSSTGILEIKYYFHKYLWPISKSWVTLLFFLMLILLKTLHDSILVERVGHAFFVIFEYEILSLLCKPCNVISIGHSQVNCRKYNIEQDWGNYVSVWKRKSRNAFLKNS